MLRESVEQEFFGRFNGIIFCANLCLCDEQRNAKVPEHAAHIGFARIIVHLSAFVSHSLIYLNTHYDMYDRFSESLIIQISQRQRR